MSNSGNAPVVSLTPALNRKRYIILIIAAVFNLPTGLGANWALVQPFVKENFGLDSGAANMPYSVFMAFFVIGNILGGQLQNKKGAKFVIILGNIIQDLGLLTLAFVPTSAPWMLSATYGLLGGTGGGMAYNAVLAAISKWFPDRKGLASGIIVALVGANGLIMSPIGNALLNNLGYTEALVAIAVIYFVLFIAGIWFIKLPPQGFMADYVPAAKVVSSGRDYTASEMVRTKEFYIIAGALAFGLCSYFLLNPMVKSLAIERGLTEAVAVAAIMVLSVANCFGRVIMPTLSDKFGRKPILIILFGVCMAAVLAMINAGGYLYLFLAGAIAFCYGGFFGIFPAIVSDQFGAKNHGLNYGIIMIGYGIIVLICPKLVSVGVGFAFTCAAVACVIGMILVLLLKSPGKAKKAAK